MIQDDDVAGIKQVRLSQSDDAVGGGFNGGAFRRGNVHTAVRIFFDSVHNPLTAEISADTSLDRLNKSGLPVGQFAVVFLCFAYQRLFFFDGAEV